MYYYYINTLFDENWIGTKICNYKLLKTMKVNQMRMIRNNNDVVENGGWHFSYLGGESQIKEKIEAYSHQEFNNDGVKNSIKTNVDNCKDLFGRNIKITIVEIDETFPKIILENKEKYKNWIK
jgi:beta-1,4-mannosyl-glycoprotein beta-1,4-N-acetylglucosaminyltransferase